jgi:hypothetical protein
LEDVLGLGLKLITREEWENARLNELMGFVGVDQGDRDAGDVDHLDSNLHPNGQGERAQQETQYSQY